MSCRFGVSLPLCWGATLVEVAVSILVISVGAIGLAGLQISAKRMAYQAVLRSEAADRASGMLERIRANHSVLHTYAVAGLGAATGNSLEKPAVDCARHSCSAVQLRAWDLWQWELALDGADADGSRGGLPSATGCIGVGARVVSVTVAWRGLQGVSDPNAATGCGAGNYAGEAGRQLLRLTAFIAGD